ncbi:MAG: nucleotidyltransferase domain-containing protein [bacterium]|nr:nucleotidyltransferase domain-containing protein [bacterium]
MKLKRDIEQINWLTKDEEAAVSEYLERLRRNYGKILKTTILFGSKARGDSDEESDIDLLVVVKDEDWSLQEEIALEAFKPMLEHDVIISPLVMGSKRFLWHKTHRAPLYRNLEAEGIELWTRTTS